MRVAAASLGVALALATACGPGKPALVVAPSQPSLNARPATAAGAALPVLAAGPRRSVFGHSVQGRALFAWSWGAPSAAKRVLVVGCIHGNEAAGISPAVALLSSPPPAGTEVTVVPDLNPDGVAVGTRQNADGVDLNRNFPQLWRRLGHRGDQQYSGSGPLSEPESRAMAALIVRLRPTVTVWFHQPVGVVDLSGGSALVERRFARVAGMATRRLARYPGSATGWQNARWPGTTAFVVELPRPVSSMLSDRVGRALRDTER